MKIVTVVGARPQFIKAAALSRVLRLYHEEILVHTGQHHDPNMSDIFFEEMEIPRPEYNLGIAGGTHAMMTGRMLIGIEDILYKERPDSVLVYGDTNSTISAALAAVKLSIPVFHVEAGNRLGTLDNPEEVNRICTDHCSTLKFCATKDAYENLVKESISNESYVVGNIMLDSFRHFKNKPIDYSKIVDFDGQPVAIPPEYYYMTCHRQENTFSDKPLTEILTAMNCLEVPTIYPVHPRNRERALRIVEDLKLENIKLIQPVGYQNSVQLTCHAKKIVTDSGGLQCEAFFAGVQCVFIFDHVAWPETMVGNRNQLAKPERNDILEKLHHSQVVDSEYKPFGDGHAAEHICDIINDWEKRV